MDYSQIAMASYMANSHGDGSNVTLEFFRHVILDSIRANLKKFKNEYGELVIACDDMGNWRKSTFKEYKAKRSLNRKEDTFDWNNVFHCLNTIRSELNDYFPYRVIKVPHAEADDVIGTLAHKHGAQLGTGSGKILILSGDKDFAQLQKYSNVYQYSPVLKKVIKENNPEHFLIEHIVKGDASDGVPNIFSQDDIFLIEGKRQVTLTAGRKAKAIEQIKSGEIPEEMQANYERNKTMIDLTMTPDVIKQEVIKQFNDQEKKINDRSKIFDYFIEKGLARIMSNIGDY